MTTFKAKVRKFSSSSKYVVIDHLEADKFEVGQTVQVTIEPI